jgi:hypothetical protein
MQGACREHAGSMQETFREHSWNIQGIFKEPHLNMRPEDLPIKPNTIQGTFKENSRYHTSTSGTRFLQSNLSPFREHSRNSQGTTPAHQT